MLRLSLCALLLCTTALSAQEPTKSYKQESINGYTVLFAPDVVKNKKECDAVRRELDVQTLRINRTLPEKGVKTLKKVKIWVEWNQEKGVDKKPNMVTLARFFPGDGWLKNNNENLDKAEGIEILNAKKFVDAPQDGCTCLLIHELAHAYEHLALQKQKAKVETAHKQAVDRKLYDDVEHFNGFRGKGYAVTNAHEYFAVLSETYFGKSQNFPYDRDGLLRYDTQGYWLMKELWDGKKQ